MGAAIWAPNGAGAGRQRKWVSHQPASGGQHLALRIAPTAGVGGFSFREADLMRGTLVTKCPLSLGARDRILAILTDDAVLIADLA